MTAQGMNMLEEELRTLRSQERPAVIRAIAEAREHGDLSENAEYHAARERQVLSKGTLLSLRMSSRGLMSLMSQSCRVGLSVLGPS